jgi:hypothetical protein
MIAPFFVARRWDKISNLARSASSFQASFQGSPCWRLLLCSFEEACRTSLRLGSFWELVFSNYEEKA